MSKRFIIIDGYNLLHTCGFIGPVVGPGMLEKARNRLLGILAKHLSPDERSRTTVVFDSGETGLPSSDTVHNILVEFAIDHDDADEMIAMLIRKHSVPKQLTIVSSDHRVQRSGLARSATVIDSDIWLDQIQTAPAAGKSDSSQVDQDSAEDEPPDRPVDVEFWMDELGVNNGSLELNPDQDPVDQNKLDRDPVDPDLKKSSGASERPDNRNPDIDDESGWQDVFPPGYGEDLLDDDSHGE